MTKQWLPFIGRVISSCWLLIVPGITMAAHQENFVLNIKTGGDFVKEINGVAALPFDTEYTILVKNNNSRRCAARVYIDGARVSPSGDFVVDAGSELDLERFVSDLDSGKRFKFVPVDHPEVDDSTRADNGIIRVEFRLEQEYDDQGTQDTIIPWEGQDWLLDGSVSDGLTSGIVELDNLSTTAIFTSTSNVSAGATIGGSDSTQLFHKVDYDFEDEFTVIELKLVGAQ